MCWCLLSIYHRYRERCHICCVGGESATTFGVETHSFYVDGGSGFHSNGDYQILVYQVTFSVGVFGFRQASTAHNLCLGLFVWLYFASFWGSNSSSWMQGLSYYYFNTELLLLTWWRHMYVRMMVHALALLHTTGSWLLLLCNELTCGPRLMLSSWWIGR